MDRVDQSEVEEEGMGCVLRVSGDEFEVDELLSRVKLLACHISRKGQRRFGPNSRIADATWFNVSTSDASESNLPAPIKDTEKFLLDHGDDIEFAMSYPGVTHAELNFSAEHRDVVVQNDFLPASLVTLAGKYRLAINISRYPSE